MIKNFDILRVYRKIWEKGGGFSEEDVIPQCTLCLLYCMYDCFHNSRDLFTYQYWFKLTGSFLQILKICKDVRGNIRLFPWFIL